MIKNEELNDNTILKSLSNVDNNHENSNLLNKQNNSNSKNDSNKTKFVIETEAEIVCLEFQIKNIILTILMISFEGVNFYLVSACFKTIKSYYKSEDLKIELYSASCMLGFGIGSLLIKYYVDFFLSRKKIISICLICCISLSLIHFIIDNIDINIFVRFLVGINLGLIIPLSINTTTEFLNKNYRGIILMYCWIGFQLGQLILITFMYFLDDHNNLKESKEINNNDMLIGIDYKLLQLLLISYYIFLFLLHFSFYIDSPQNLIYSNKEIEGIALYQKLIDKSLDESNKNELVKRFKFKDDIEICKNNKQYYSIMVFLCISNFISTLELYGPMIIYNFMVTALGNKSMDYAEKIIDLSKEATYSEMIFYIMTSSLNVVIGGIIIELKFLGRKGSFYMANMLIIIFSILILIDKSNFIFYNGFITILTFMIANIVSVFNSEVFPFHIRDKYVGIAYFFLRLGAFSSQIIFVETFKINILMPIYLMIFLSFINSLSFYMIPYETRGRSLELKS